MQLKQSGPWPEGRAGHAACCLNYSQQYPQLLVSGGLDRQNRPLGDVWILDVERGNRRKVRIFFTIVHLNFGNNSLFFKYHWIPRILLRLVIGLTKSDSKDSCMSRKESMEMPLTARNVVCVISTICTVYTRRLLKCLLV